MKKIRVLLIFIIIIVSVFFQLLPYSQTFLFPKTSILVLREDQAPEIPQINLTLRNTPTKQFLSATEWTQRVNGKTKTK